MRVLAQLMKFLKYKSHHILSGIVLEQRTLCRHTNAWFTQGIGQARCLAYTYERDNRIWVTIIGPSIALLMAIAGQSAKSHVNIHWRTCAISPFY